MSWKMPAQKLAHENSITSLRTWSSVPHLEFFEATTAFVEETLQIKLDSSIKEQEDLVEIQLQTFYFILNIKFYNITIVQVLQSYFAF